jgi:hypothetical protein
MTDHIEWVSAEEPPQGYTSADLRELAEDGNPQNEIGLRMGLNDGAMLIGTTRQMVDWLEKAVLEVKRICGIEMAERIALAENNIDLGLSRDDENEFGSEFKDRVGIIRNLNGVLSTADYRLGQVDMLMETTAWNEMRPDRGDVYLYVFSEELP